MKPLILVLILSLFLYGCSNNTYSEEHEDEQVNETLTNEEIDPVMKHKEETLKKLKNTTYNELEMLRTTSIEIENIIKEMENIYVEFLVLTTQYRNSEISFDEYFDKGVLKSEKIYKVLEQLDLISINEYMFDDIPNAINESKVYVELMASNFSQSISSHLEINLYEDYSNKDAFTFSETANENGLNALRILREIEMAYETAFNDM